jgi:hypothetical protein
LESRKNLGYPRGGRVKITTGGDSPEWKDRDSIDNSSQKKILGLPSSVEAYSSEESSQHRQGKGLGGIVATTEVEVHHSSMTVDDIERQGIKKQGGEW